MDKKPPQPFRTTCKYCLDELVHIYSDEELIKARQGEDIHPLIVCLTCDFPRDNYSLPDSIKLTANSRKCVCCDRRWNKVVLECYVCEEPTIADMGKPMSQREQAWLKKWGQWCWWDMRRELSEAIKDK